MAKIVDKINEVHEKVKAGKETGDPEAKAEANRIKNLATKAILNGIKSRDWEMYMKEFARDNDPELEKRKLARLIGEDDAFNNTEWGFDSLAYIAANATCDLNTTVGTVNNMSEEMKNNLDNFGD